MTSFQSVRRGVVIIALMKILAVMKRALVVVRPIMSMSVLAVEIFPYITQPAQINVQRIIIK